MTDQYDRTEQVPRFTKDRLIRIESKLSRFLIQWEDISRRVTRIEDKLDKVITAQHTHYQPPQDQEA